MQPYSAFSLLSSAPHDLVPNGKYYLVICLSQLRRRNYGGRIDPSNDSGHCILPQRAFLSLKSRTSVY